ncbi:MAG: hypothetical protein J6C50_03135 [Rickettsiales bacterium]|nr:hypothetical protein [Rickettsiales bacterium]
MKKIFFIILLCMCTNVFATEKKNVNVVVDGAYYDWNVYYIDDLSGEKKCYIASFAKNSIGNYKKDRKPYIMIAYFKAKEAEEVSIYADYDYKLKSSIYVGIDSKQFRMFTKGKMAWTKNMKEDRTMIKEMLKAKTIKTRGETITGEYTVDTFSTNGLARAYDRMRELCED